jgi:hypothetical protein
MGLTEDASAIELRSERTLGLTDDDARAPAREDGLQVFALSGGLMRSSITSNRIDSLLSKMIERPGAGRYVRNVDQNLDYLFTSLQLDMIRIIADESGKGKPQGTSILRNRTPQGATPQE